MQLNHLNIDVRDIERSRRFYEAYFGFDLALHPVGGEEQEWAGFHFGFRLAEKRAVADLLRQMEGEGVTVVEREDEDGFLSFKCLDPDGYRIEVYWEEGRP